MIHFGRALPCIFQAIREADPVQGPFGVSEFDVIDAYHRGILRTSQVGVFAYIIPSAPGYEGCIICIDLVLPIGWMESPKCFCTFSGTLTDVANVLVDKELLVAYYDAIFKISEPPRPTYT